MKDRKEYSILENLEIGIAIDNLKEGNFNEEDKIIKEWGKVYIKRITTTILGFFVVLASSITVMANYENIINSFGFGSGIDRAVEDGYIAQYDMEFKESKVSIKNKNGEIIDDNASVCVKIENFLMDDVNLNTHFKIQLDKRIMQILNINNLTDLQIDNIKIIDEENRKINENTGFNYFIDDIQENIVDFTYNIYEGYEEKMPKSKKLFYKFSTIILNNNENKIYLTGDWQIEVEVPQFMYERNAIEYKVVNCDNSDFNVYSAKATNTGFEIGITISNVEIEENPLNEIYKEYSDGNITFEELNKLEKKKREEAGFLQQYEKYLQSTIPVKVDIEDKNSTNMVEKTSYIENEDGKKYFCSMSPGRKNNQNFIEEKTLDFYETFELTKNEATNKLKVRLMYNEVPVIIELMRNS